MHLRNLAGEDGLERVPEIGLGAARILVIRVWCSVVDEPVLGVEEEDLRSPRGAVGLCDVLCLVVQEREREVLLLRACPHVADGIAEVARVRVDRDEAGPVFVLAGNVVDPVLPGDNVRAVDAGEDDG